MESIYLMSHLVDFTTDLIPAPFGHERSISLFDLLKFMELLHLEAQRDTFWTGLDTEAGSR